MNEDFKYENLNKINYPLFFEPLINLVIGVFFGLIGIIPFFFPNINNHEPLKVQLNWFIGIISLVLLIIIFAIRYVLNINKFKKEYEEQIKKIKLLIEHSAQIDKDFAKKQEEISNLENKLNEFEFIMIMMINSVKLGCCNRSIEEKEFLTNLYTTLLMDKEYIYKIKGEN